MNAKNMLRTVALFVVAVLSMTLAVSALPVSLDEVSVDGTEVSPGSTNSLDIERGRDFVVRVELSTAAAGGLDDIELSARISGYEYNDVASIEDRTSLFDMDENVTYVKRLRLTLPDDVEEDTYLLKVYVDSRVDSFTETYSLKLDVPRKSMRIEDVVFNPENEVKAGRSLLTLVRVENTGERDQDGVKVNVNIPELRVSASDYIDEVEAGDEVTSEALYLRMPACANPGVYNVDVTVTYDQGHRSEKKSLPLTVTEDDRCSTAAPSQAPATVPEKTIITVGPTTQEVAAGNGAVFPVTLTNAGQTAKTYVLSADGVEGWSTLKVTPSNVAVLSGQESETLYVTVTPNSNAVAGSHSFVMSVKSGDEVLQQVPATVSVSGAAPAASSADAANWDKVKKGLEIGLVVLVVLLVILGLIIAFNKMKNDEDEEDSGDAGQTYY